MKDLNEVFAKHEDIINMYFENDGKRLYKMVDDILYKLKFNVNKEDFYSLANELFIDILARYDEVQEFKGFLYSCLYKKFCTEMTKRRRIKRTIDRTAISLDTPIGEDENVTVGDTICDKNNTVEKKLFEKREEESYSEKMITYLSRLSDLQKEVLKLISIGFEVNEILEELHINKKMYEDCYNAIHSYRNVSTLI